VTRRVAFKDALAFLAAIVQSRVFECTHETRDPGAKAVILP
jgi:hypothetical protein